MDSNSPLAGDPLKLSEFMVRNEGRLIPTSKAQLDEFPECLQTTVEIMKTCRVACTSPDPLDPDEKPFIANAIIANPVSNGHFHCADAMGIPLHMMFPQVLLLLPLIPLMPLLILILIRLCEALDTH
jgi:hypothetical protein